eukprot:gnl/MRDRNA2_/MRDRNA2_142440_c0_seq1.p1 gnl/MRDRNA2_/MRDRNA2_142440_c0~~gnl/MRDRNA2_/MRDRNA2_142440_c0_seq1.p1  ORF type:complete len:140 (-),score=20.39 gnl/MRDRNA2_/MRDRNA2_142440_c0_seq1:491-910(-)
MGATRALLTIKVGDSTLYVNTEAQATQFIDKWIAAFHSTLPSDCVVGSSQALECPDTSHSINEALAAAVTKMNVLQERLSLIEQSLQYEPSSLGARLDQLEHFLREAPLEHFHKLDTAIAALSSTVPARSYAAPSELST